MPSQVLSEQSVGIQAFAALLRGYANVTRQVNAQLLEDHGLTVADYSVLLRLAWAPDGRMRRVDLADHVLLTASGVTRLLDGLEREGLVERGSCDADRRVVYAVLTDAGMTRLREASETHVPHVEALLAARYDEEELTALRELLFRLAEDDAASCAPPD